MVRCETERKYHMSARSLSNIVHASGFVWQKKMKLGCARLTHLNCKHKRSLLAGIIFPLVCLARDLFLWHFKCNCYRFIHICEQLIWCDDVDDERDAWENYFFSGGHNNRIADDEGRCDQDKCKQCFAQINLLSSHHYATQLLSYAEQQRRREENRPLINRRGWHRADMTPNVGEIRSQFLAKCSRNMRAGKNGNLENWSWLTDVGWIWKWIARPSFVHKLASWIR